MNYVGIPFCETRGRRTAFVDETVDTQEQFGLVMELLTVAVKGMHRSENL
jgi:hypothetical protein